MKRGSLGGSWEAGEGAAGPGPAEETEPEEALGEARLRRAQGWQLGCRWFYVGCDVSPLGPILPAAKHPHTLGC